MRTWLLTGILCVAGPAWAADSFRVSTVPSPIVLTQETTAIQIEIEGLGGKGTVRAAVNVGSVEKIQLDADKVRLLYHPPDQRFPQMLCLAAWREMEGARVHVVRFPMEGRTVVPVQTRHHSEITVAVGRRLFGPHSTGAGGKRRVRLLVPPGVQQAVVHVKDKYGMETSKKIRIEARPYNQLTVAVADVSGRKERFEITVATAEQEQQHVHLEIGGQRAALRQIAPGTWSAAWTPAPGSHANPVLKAWIAGAPASALQTEVNLGRAAPKTLRAELTTPGPSVQARSTTTAGEARGRTVRGVLALGVGLIHNTGAFVSPRFSAECGLDLRIARGWLGLRALAGVSWGNLAVDETAGFRHAESSVLLVPLGGGLSYSLPLTYFTPYVMVGLLAQLVRTRTAAELVEERLRYDVVFAAVGMVGAERRLGPGSFFLQLGGQWSRVENADLKLLAGGVVLEGGYRFVL